MRPSKKNLFLTAKDPKGDWAEHVGQVWPDVHGGNIQLQVLIGPDRLFAKYRLNNLRSRRLQITRSIYKPGGWTRKHAHPDHEHVYYVIRGHARVTVGTVRRVLGPGDVAYIPMGVEHGYATYGGEPVELFDIYACEDADLPTSWPSEKPAEKRAGAGHGPSAGSGGRIPWLPHARSTVLARRPDSSTV